MIVHNFASATFSKEDGQEREPASYVFATWPRATGGLYPKAATFIPIASQEFTILVIQACSAEVEVDVHEEQEEKGEQ